MKKKFSCFIAGIISFMTFLVYLPSLQNGFVHWDDPRYVFQNPNITSFDVPLFKWAFFDFYAGNWHPLTWISHALDYAVWGLNPMGHHLTNNVLHAVNTFIVVLLVVRLIEAAKPFTIHYSSASVATGDSPRRADPPGAGDSRFILIAAGVTGLLFGLHPIHVESVAWVAERKDLLCALFFLLSIMAYVKYAPSPQSPPLKGGDATPPLRSRGGWGALFLSLFFFTLALLSKPMAVSLPFVLLILDWYPFKRIHSGRFFRSVFIEKVPFLSLSLLSAIVTVLAQKSGDSVISLESIPLSARMIVAPKALINYLSNMIFPWNLSPFYPYPQDPSFFSPEYLFPIAFTIGFTVFCIAIAKKERLWPAVWAYYIITLLPVIGIVQVGIQAMADRYAYLPSLAPFLLVGLAVTWLAGKVSAIKKGVIGPRLFAAAAVILLLGPATYLTVKQITVWKDDFVLWNYIIERAPERVYFAYMNRGIVYSQMEQFDKAIDDYNIAAALNQSDSQIFVNRGQAYLALGRIQPAIRDFNKACELGDSFGCAAPQYIK